MTSITTMPASTRTSTITTSTTKTYISVSSFLPPRAEQRIHIWLSEIGSSSPTQHNDDDMIYGRPTLHHGRLSIAQIYATKEAGPSFRERLRRLRPGRKKEVVFGFPGERIGGDLGGNSGRTEMYGLDVPSMGERASLKLGEDGAVVGRGQLRIMKDASGDLWGEDGIVRLNGSDYGAGLVGERRLEMQAKRRSHQY